MAAFPQFELSATSARALDFRVTDDKVRQAVEQVVAASNPVQVIAFGSWARGEHGPESDLDLAIILDDQSICPARGKLRASMRISMSIDVLEMTGHELLQKSLRLNSVHRDIIEEGVVLYQRAGTYRASCIPVPTRKDLLDVKVDEVRLTLKKARSDEETLGFDGISPQIAAFHGQQAIEKLLKAWLIVLDVPPPKTHELDKLEDVLLALGKHLPSVEVTLKTFNDYAVKWRYADIPDPDRIDLAAMRATVAHLREYVTARISEAMPEMSR